MVVTKRILVLASLVTITLATPMVAWSWCDNLAGQQVVVGEIISVVKDGTDSVYANAYADGGDQIRLAWGKQIGWVSGAGNLWDMVAPSNIADEASWDCETVSNFLEGFYYAIGNVCTDRQGGIYMGRSSHTVNTCTTGSMIGTVNAYRSFSSRMLRIPGNGAADIRSTVSAITTEVSPDQDSGCFSVTTTTNGCTN